MEWLTVGMQDYTIYGRKGLGFIQLGLFFSRLDKGTNDIDNDYVNAVWAGFESNYTVLTYHTKN